MQIPDADPNGTPPAQEQLERLRERIGSLLPGDESEVLLASIRALLAGGKLLQYAERDELAQMLEAALEQFQAMAGGIRALRELRRDAAIDEAGFSGQMKTAISGMREEILGARCPKPLEESLQRALVSLEGSHTALHSREKTRARSYQEALDRLSASVHMLAEETRERLEQLQLACLQQDVHPLTGLPGHNALQVRLGRECLAALQSNAPLALIAMAPDPAEQPPATAENAELRIAQTVAEIITASLRQNDFAAHDDSGCFLVVLPGAGLAEAGHVADKLLAQFSRRPVAIGNREIILTASCGIACYWEYDTPPVIAGRARLALSRAREAGGNRIMTWEDT